MKRLAFLTVSAAALVAGGLAFAQPQPPAPPAGGPGPGPAPQTERTDRDQPRGEGRFERRQERFAERLSKLRADMQLKPEQATLFDQVETVLKKNMEERRERGAAMRDQRDALRDADIMERLEVMADRATQRAQRSKELADAVRPLWQTLSDQQKTVVRRSVREITEEGRGRMMRMHEHMGERGGRHDRMQDRGMQEREGRHERMDDNRGPRRWSRDDRQDDRRGDWRGSEDRRGGDRGDRRRDDRD